MPINPEIQNPDGRWKKGAPSPNPNGRRSPKRLNELLDIAFPDEFLTTILFAKIAGLNTNLSNQKDVVKLIKDKEFKKTFRKYMRNVEDGAGTLGNKDLMDTIFKIWERRYGKAVQEIELDSKTIDVELKLPEGIDTTGME